MGRLLVLIMLSLLLMAGTAYAEMEAVADSDMDEVSAQGLQQILNDNRGFEPPLSGQNNNLDSVQLNHSQERVSIWSLVNSAKSAVNVTANVLVDGPPEGPGPGPEPPPPAEGKSFSTAYSQSNDDEAENHTNRAMGLVAVAINLNKETQTVTNTGGSKVEDQNNNNNSVQLNGFAQAQANGYTVLNVSTSAVNEAVNLVVAGDVSGTTGSQSNWQKATNMSNLAVGSNEFHPVLAIALNAEMGPRTQTVNNQDSTEFSDTEISDQNNNNNSVQINDSAQKNMVVESALNSAQSAVNIAANIASMGNVDGSLLTQSNESKAINHMNVALALGAEGSVAIAKNFNKETQGVRNGADAVIDGQNNNNNSVQVNDDAQRYAKGILLENSALSATNAALNLMATGDVSASTISQSNSQFASNFSNIAVGETAIAANKETGTEGMGLTQEIINVYGPDGEILDQDNNNNSVQLNDNAQGGEFDGDKLMADKVINAAKSAVNAGQNILTTGVVSGSSISQSNAQYAGNHNNYAVGQCALAANVNKQTQRVGNAEAPEFAGLELIEDQDNNLNSVQVNDSAQRNVQAVFLENIAGSASNMAMNVLSTGSVEASTLTQSNAQCARNFDNIAVGDGAVAVNGEMNGATQEIENVHATIVDQDNNNNSVQLNDDAQRNIEVDKTINAAMSAVNAGQNIMSVGDVSGSTVSQSNSQYAANHNNTAIAADLGIAANVNKQTQTVHNCYCTDLNGGTQDNNLNSVQLNGGAQNGATGILVANLADSSANAGLNMITAGTVSGSTITQSNTSKAVNFSNTAIGTTAIAGNVELLPMMNGQ